MLVKFLVMFKLQLLLGLVLCIQINLIRAEQQLIASAKLGNATLEITMLNSGKAINTTNTELSEETNPEEGNYIEGDLLSPTESPSALQHINSLNGQRNDINPKVDNYIPQDPLNSIFDYVLSALQTINPILDQVDNIINAETNNFPDDDNPKESDEIINNFPDDGNPEEGDELEGDLLMPTGNLLRSSITKPNSLWPNGLVPYELNGTFTHKQLKFLYHAFDQYAKRTCIRFFPRTTEKDFVSIVKPKTGCSSNVGRMGGKQILNLAPTCFRRGTIMHELMHILGFLHEQNSFDRDDFVKIFYENLSPGREVNFRKFKEEETTNLNVTYDYGSLMHYRANAFSKNGKPTMVALKEVPNGVRMGQRKYFSRNDLIRINRRYQCHKNPVSIRNKKVLLVR